MEIDHSVFRETPVTKPMYVHWYYVTGTTRFRSETYWRSVISDNPDGRANGPAGYTYFRSTQLGVSGHAKTRERTPYDEPSGPGYTAKVVAGQYVTNKDYRIYKSSYSGLHRVYPKYKYYGYDTFDYLPCRFWIEARAGNQLVPCQQMELLHRIPQAAEVNARDRAIFNLYGSLQRRQDINLGVFLAEFKESIGSIGRMLLTLTRVIRSLKKGRVSDALSALGDHFAGSSDFSDKKRKVLGGRTNVRIRNRDRLNRDRKRRGLPPISSADYAANMWLELQFGWLPLLSDLHDLVQVVNGSLSNEGDGILSFKGYGTSKVIADVPVYISAGTASMKPSTYSATYTCKYTCVATYKAGNSLMSILGQLGLLNPLSVAWEVVPFSFVIDWVLPIGSWLNSLQADAGLELIQYCESRKRTCTGSIPYHEEYFMSIYTDENNLGHLSERNSISGSLTYTGEEFERYASNQVAIPPLPFPTLTWDELLDPWKAITSLALLR